VISGSGTGMRLLCTRDFPRRFPSAGLPHRALIGVGGNLGDVRQRFARVLRYLKRSRLLRPLSTAPLLRNPPFGYTEQPDFLNSLILVETALGPERLLRYLLWVEKRFGRTRSFPNAPRTLDLDIIFFDDLHRKSRRLTLPHPHFAERDSVMIPLLWMLAPAGRLRCTL